MSGAGIAHAVLCATLFACAAVLLGLTAYHIHFTETMFTVSFYVPIVVELLVTSCLAIIVSLWSFIAVILCHPGRKSYGGEIALIIIIWIMFLVGASIFSAHVCRILSAIIEAPKQIEPTKALRLPLLDQHRPSRLSLFLFLALFPSSPLVDSGER